MTPRIYITSSLLENYLTNQDTDIALQGAELFDKAEQGEIIALLEPITIATCVDRMSALYPADKLTLALTKTVLLEGVMTTDEDIVLTALDLYRTKDNHEIPFGDVYLEACVRRGHGKFASTQAEA